MSNPNNPTYIKWKRETLKYLRTGERWYTFDRGIRIKLKRDILFGLNLWVKRKPDNGNHYGKVQRNKHK